MSKNWQSRSMATAQLYLNPHDLHEKNSNIAAGEINSSPADSSVFKCAQRVPENMFREFRFTCIVGKLGVATTW